MELVDDDNICKCGHSREQHYCLKDGETMCMMCMHLSLGYHEFVPLTTRYVVCEKCEEYFDHPPTVHVIHHLQDKWRAKNR